MTPNSSTPPHSVFEHRGAKAEVVFEHILNHVVRRQRIEVTGNVLPQIAVKWLHWCMGENGD